MQLKASIEKKQTLAGELNVKSIVVTNEVDPVYTADKPFIALKSEVEEEIVARQDANNVLQINIDTEVTNRTVAIDSVESEIVILTDKVNGVTVAYAFDTETDMYNTIADPQFKETLKVGDNLYIREPGVPDYWWDGVQPLPLDTEKVDLSNYYTKQEVTDKDTQVAYQVLQAVDVLLGNKVDKVTGERLITAEEANKLAGVATGAEKNTIQKVYLNGQEQAPDNNRNVNLADVATMTYVDSKIGDINSVLDAINGVVI